MEILRYHRISLLMLLLFVEASVAANDNVYAGIGSSIPAAPIVHKEPLSEEESLKNLQKDMLELFGHKNRPRPDIFSSIGRTTSSAKRYMLNLYHAVAEVRDDLSNEVDVHLLNATSSPAKLEEDPVAGLFAKKADTVVSFVNHGYAPRPNVTDEQGSMYFDLSSNLVIEATLASELRLYLDVGLKKTHDTVLRVTVYQIIRPKTDYLPLSSRVINASASGWHEFDILSATNVWKERPSSNHGVVVICTSMSGMRFKFSDCGLVDFLGHSDYRPFLVSFYQSGSEDEILAEQIPEAEESKIYIHQRIRRSLRTLFPKASEDLDSYKQDQSDANRKKRDDATQHCRRHALYIGFKDLGWSDWIIAPNGFKAEYCRGECSFPLSRNMNASNHAIIQTLVHLMSPKKIPEPCCAPLRLHPLQVLYLDDNNNVVMKKYANMIVKDCGCQ